MTPVAGPPPTQTAAHGTPANPPVVDPAFNKRVVEAVQRLNETEYAGKGRVVTFSIDTVSRRLVVKVIDVQTEEVVQQWPGEYVLRLDANRIEKR